MQHTRLLFACLQLHWHPKYQDNQIEASDLFLKEPQGCDFLSHVALSEHMELV